MQLEVRKMMFEVLIFQSTQLHVMQHLHGGLFIFLREFQSTQLHVMQRYFDNSSHVNS